MRIKQLGHISILLMILAAILGIVFNYDWSIHIGWASLGLMVLYFVTNTINGVWQKEKRDANYKDSGMKEAEEVTEKIKKQNKTKPTEESFGVKMARLRKEKKEEQEAITVSLPPKI